MSAVDAQRDFLAPREVADRVGVSYHSVLRAIHRGDLAAFEVVGRLRIAIPDWTSTNATTIAEPWFAWQAQPQALTVDTASTVWVNWQTANVTPLYVGAPPPPLTPEQEAERQARYECAARQQARASMIYRNRERARTLRRKPAMRRAEALLLENLSAAQREEWQAERAFTVHIADGKRAYKIAYGLAGNVRLVKAEDPPIAKGRWPIRVGARFCMHVYHPDGWVPNEDNVLAQKLLIESNEEHFLSLANVS